MDDKCATICVYTFFRNVIKDVELVLNSNLVWKGYKGGEIWRISEPIFALFVYWDFSHPQVLKYKGECPVEDYGGIYGYYECLESVNNPDHPEYQERMDWMQH